jgi:predicted transcriptional regulator of viral defense system
MTHQMLPTTFDKAKALFRRHGGLLRTSEALRLGIHPRTLYAMRDEGVLEQLSRGLYRLTELPPLGAPDFVAVARKVSAGVICLVSALAFHELTTEIPHAVYVALARGTEPPRLDYPPMRIFWFTGDAFTKGIEIHKLDHVAVPVYTPEKTLADCFKYRHKLGLDVAVEALKLYRQRKQMRLDELLRFARICRVEKVMRPYLEAIL